MPDAQRPTAQRPTAAAQSRPAPRFTLIRSILRNLPRRIPFTIALALAIVVVGLVTGTLVTPAATQPWFEGVATGLPAFAEGRWYTVFTSPFFSDPPYQLLFIAPVLLGGVGWAEWRFGSLRAAALFVGGHLVGVLGAAAVVALIAPTGWPWAERLAQTFDVGPSAGAFACLAFVTATLPSPWRLRARVALAIWAAIEVLYLGQLASLEHAIAITVALIVSGSLPAFRHPAGRPSTREWRLVAFAGLIVIGVVQVIDLAIPVDGPLGVNTPVASALDVAVDVVVIALIANGVRQGLRVAWIVTLVLAGVNLATLALGVALTPLLLATGVVESPAEVLVLVLPAGLLWLAECVVLVVGRGAFHVRLRRSRRAHAVTGIDRDEALARLRTHGGGTIGWMIGWAPNRYLPVEFTGEGAGDAAGGSTGGSGASTGTGTSGTETGTGGVVAYQAHAGVAIALGDPVAPPTPAARAAALEAFARSAEQAGLIPCVFSASAASAAAKPAGWRSTIVAEDTIVELPGLELKGKRWQPVRTSVNRAAREGIEFRMCTLADEPWNVLAQVRAISEQWTGDKGLPEMRFTLGTVDEALDRETRVGIAVDAEGNLHGVTSWLPVHEHGEIVGWTLDLMRRRDDGFGPVMEFLIASSALHFAEQGYRFVSLSGAPLVRPADAEAGPVDHLLDRIGELIEPLYGFRSLHQFKQKFNPQPATLHLLYRDEGDLPRIAIALTRAYLPDATLRDLVSSATHA